MRTVISLNEDDKKWLDQKAAREGVSMTELVRRAVKRLRVDETSKDLDGLLDATAGTRRGEDGLKVQKRLPDEWRRSA